MFSSCSEAFFFLFSFAFVLFRERQEVSERAKVYTMAQFYRLSLLLYPTTLYLFASLMPFVLEQYSNSEKSLSVSVHTALFQNLPKWAAF